MKKLTLLTTILLGGWLYTNAQTSCNDLNGYPQSKNVNSVGAFTLVKGVEEKAAQAYHYSGPGKITSVRIYGYTPNIFTGVALSAKIYNVDVNDRPTTVIGSKNFQWTSWDNMAGYKDVSMPSSGVSVSANFAVSVEITSGFTSVTQFQVGYNGNGEGNGEDLASLSGTSTGFNWASAMTDFGRDGDFYIIPKMKHYINADFSVSSACINTGGTVNFTNYTEMTLDSMFNTIGLSNYSGSENFYAWNFGDGSPISYAVNPSHTYSSNSVYTVTLTVAIDGWNNTCTHTKTMQISVGLNVSAASVTGVTCNGGANGSIIATASGGATPYKYSLDGFTYQTSATFSNLGAGTYTLYVKDNLGCIKTTAVVVSQPGPIIFAPISSTNASCGNSDGALLASASGGVGSLQYSINGTSWQSNGTFSSLPAGGYTVWVRDANGCIKTTNAIVNDQGGPSLTINSYTHVSCNGGNNGSIIASGSGGSGTLQYSINGTNFQLSGSFTTVPAGTYNVIVKDANGCIDVATVIISAPPVLSLTATSNPVSCNGGNDGQINVVSAIGGTGTLIYSVNGVNYQSSPTFNGLAAGTYTVYVKDVASCTATTSVSVAQPTIVVASATTSNLTCNSSANGSITIGATGGTPGYIFSIDGTNFYPTGDFTDLAAGTYTITVKDENGCTGTTTVTLTQPTPISATITTGNSTCGNSNGNMLAIASGGSGSGYQYSINGTNWNSTGSFTNLSDSSYIIIIQDGAGCTSIFQATVTDANGPSINTVSFTNVTCAGGNNGTITVTNVTGGSGTLYYRVDGSPWQLSTSFTGVSAGQHIIVVRDGLMCTGSYTVTLTQPAPITMVISTVNLTCYGGSNGSISVTAGGGQGTLAYSKDCGETFQSSGVFNNLTAGSYCIVVIDAGGCSSTMIVNVTQPRIIEADFGILQVSCFGANDGALYIIAGGGTGALQYSLDGINYQTTNTFSNLSGGAYSVYIKDANGCVVIFNLVINEPLPLSTAYNVYNVTCAGGNDGVIDITALGGTPPYSFAWSNGATTEDIFNLAAGVYSVTVTDANGCTMLSGFTITQPSNPLIVNASITNTTSTTATDGSIDITITGGTPPYTYSWSNGATTQDITGIAAGVYVVMITDANGCVTSGIYTVNVSTGIADVNADFNINIYPNPANEQIFVEADGKMIQKVEIFNVVGEVIYIAEPKTLKAHVNTSSYADGIYFVKLTIEGNTVTKKIQISK